MPHTQSFTRLWPSVLALLFVGLSMYGRSVAARVPAAGALHRGAVRNRLDNQSRAI
jgi:glutamine synthetase